MQVGRAGRFGTKGVAINMLANEEDTKLLKSLKDTFDMDISVLPDNLKTSDDGE